MIKPYNLLIFVFKPTNYIPNTHLLNILNTFLPTLDYIYFKTSIQLYLLFEYLMKT